MNEEKTEREKISVDAAQRIVINLTFHFHFDFQPMFFTVLVGLTSFRVRCNNLDRMRRTEQARCRWFAISSTTSHKIMLTGIIREHVYCIYY